MNLIFFTFLAYLFGSIPFGFIIAQKVKRIDIREHGSKNIGATNVFRVVGKKWGILVMVLDALKGYLGVAIAKHYGGASIASHFYPFIGIAAILGHSFPVWLKFKGGKGVATSLGAFLGLAPLPTGITFAIWWVVFLVSRILSLASISAALVFPIVIVLTYRANSAFPWLFPVSLLLAAFILYTHRANLGRLAKGEEKKLF